MAGGRAGMSMSRPFLESLIRKAGRIPCERDTLYHPVSTPETKPDAIAPDPAPAEQPAQLVHLALNASLHQLSRLADQKPTVAMASCEPTVILSLADLATSDHAVQRAAAAIAEARTHYGVLPAAITIDLAATASIPGESKPIPIPRAHLELLQLAGTIGALRKSFPGVNLALAGIKSLWELTQAAVMERNEALERFAEAGLDQIQGSPSETESDLTHREVIDFHRLIHAYDMKTIARVELMAPTHWSTNLAAGTHTVSTTSASMWQSFVRRAMAFAELQAKTGGLIGISVEVSSGSFVSPIEYLRAVAIARLASTGVSQVIAPLALVPTLSPSKGLGSNQKQHPAEKFAAVALHYGANDLGAIDPKHLNPLAIMQQIRASGFVPKLRGAKIDELANDSSFIRDIDAIRHRPVLDSAL